MKYWIWIVFAIMIIAQWWVPADMVRLRSNTLRNGKAFRFRTEPVDPTHPFKGKYISLNFEADRWKDGTGKTFESGETVFVSLATDKNGFASIQRISSSRPGNETDYIKAEVGYTSYDSVVYIRYPFTEFYMDEYKAPAAERLYLDANSISKKKTYAVVKIYHGNAVMEDLFINDKPIRSLLK